MSALQPRCTYLVSPELAREAATEVEAVAGRALELADACQSLYLTQPLLTAVGVVAGSAAGGAGADAGDADAGGVLVLTLVEPDVSRVKLEVGLRLRDLLAHAHPSE